MAADVEPDNCGPLTRGEHDRYLVAPVRKEQRDPELASDAPRGKLKEQRGCCVVDGRNLWLPKRQGYVEARNDHPGGGRGQCGIDAHVRCRRVVPVLFAVEGEVGEVGLDAAPVAGEDAGALGGRGVREAEQDGVEEVVG